MSMVQVESYTFSTVENPLSNGGNFTIIADTNFTSSLRAVSGNLCEPTTVGAIGGAFWSGAVPAPSNTWPADHYAEITLSTWATSNDFAYMVLRQGAFNSGTQYIVNVGRSSGGSTGTCAILAVVAGTLHSLQSNSGVTTAQGDVWRASVTGNVITVLRNGSQVFTFTDTNNFVTSGSPGFGLNAVTLITNAQTGLVAFGANQAATPTFSPVAGTYTGTQTVTITSTSGGTIYYTTNGTTPTHASSSISSGGTILLSASATVKAIASQTNFVDSAVGSAAYVINGSNGGSKKITAGYATDVSAAVELNTNAVGEISSNRTTLFGTNRGTRLIA